METSNTEHIGVQRLQRQRCKVCWSSNGFCFQVPDDVWLRVLSSELQNHVVCLACFDDIASEKGIDYIEQIQSLCFVGRKVALGLTITGVWRDK